MQPLISHPQPAVAETIPTGVASTDGRLCFVSSPGGIAALDTKTGATAWTTSEAQVPILALPDALLAIRGADPIDGAWTGSGALVAIDLAAPHAARAGAPFDLPLTRHRLLDVHIAGGALVAGWHATGVAGGALTPRPPDVRGSIQIDLTSGAATIAPASHVPDAVRQALANTTAWLPPWRTRNGWSALVFGGTATALSMILRHWPDTGDEREVLLLDQLAPPATSALHATARHAFVHTCPAHDHCELRAYDAETGAPVKTFGDPLPARLGQPFALVGDYLLAVQRSVALGGSDRALVLLEGNDPAATPRWRHPIAPEPPPEVRS